MHRDGCFCCHSEIDAQCCSIEWGARGERARSGVERRVDARRRDLKRSGGGEEGEWSRDAT